MKRSTLTCHTCVRSPSHCSHEYYWVTNEPSAMYPPASGWQVEATIGQQPPPNVTPMHGQCYTNGTCVCDTGYFGPNCQQQCNATLMCSGHGQCKNDMCSCGAGFAGPSCLECGPVLLGPPVTTVPHGIWDDGKCQCLSGYAGDMCGEKSELWCTVQRVTRELIAVATMCPVQLRNRGGCSGRGSL